MGIWIETQIFGLQLEFSFHHQEAKCFCTGIDQGPYNHKIYGMKPSVSTGAIFPVAITEEETSSLLSVSIRGSCVADGVPVDNGVVPPLAPCRGLGS